MTTLDKLPELGGGGTKTVKSDQAHLEEELSACKGESSYQTKPLSKPLLAFEHLLCC